MRNENIVEFPTGRLLTRSAKGRTTVAALARKLWAGSRIRQIDLEGGPLQIELRDLTGVSDRTVKLLSALAADGILTSASAARLAMRHALEAGRVTSGTVVADQACRHTHRLVLAGDMFSRCAFRIVERTGEAWVACATFAALDLLSRVCPSGGAPICLVPGLDGQAQPSVVLRRPRDWRIDLAHLADGADRAAEQHVLVVGGLPRSGRNRAVIIAGIKDGLRRSGLRVRCGRSFTASEIATADERERHARRHLVLIEIAFPGLVQGLGATR